MASADAASAQAWIEAANREPLLTPAEELHLGGLIQAWQGWEPTPDAAPKAVKRRGLKARDRMIRGNLRLAASFANKRQSTIPLVDRCQNAALGLAKAAEKFDPTRGYKFSTVAYWWMRAETGKGQLLERAILLPSNVDAAVRGQANGECPPHLLAAGLAASFVLSLDFVISGDSESAALGGLIAAPGAVEDPQLDVLLDRLAALDPIEQRLIEGRWLPHPTAQLDPLKGRPLSYEQLAAQEAISVAEVKRILDRAMCKLRGQVYIEKKKRSIRASLCVWADGTIHGHCGQWLGKAGSQQEAERYCVQAGWRYEVIDPGSVTLRGRPLSRRRHRQRPP